MLNFSKWKITIILSICLLGVWGAMPNFLSEATRAQYADLLPSKTVSLGLDLKGGVYLELGVDNAEVIRARLESISDEVKDIRRDDRLSIRQIKVNATEVSFNVRKAEDIPTVMQKLRPLTQIANPTNLIGTNKPEVEINSIGDGNITITLTEFGVDELKRQALAQVISVLGKRLDPEGTREMSMQPSGEDRVILQIPGVKEVQPIIDLINQQAVLTFHMVDDNTSPDDILQGRIRPGSMVADLYDGETYQGQIAIERRVMLTGENLKKANVTFDQNNQTVVGFTFDTAGGKKFGDITRRNVGKRFAIKLDDRVITAPVIQGVILGGSGIIQGSFSVEKADELSTLMNAGALPAKLTVLDQQLVGPDLGADNIEAGKKAIMIGFLGVIVFMILSYGRFGLAANAALIINVVMILGLLSLLSATLTLPGIAGIVLTMGMAVDANVLVFERIREEQILGRSPMNALESGYKQALSTIFDANITTFIAAALLYFLGSGPIKGFAVTLSIGIITSVFTAVVVTRLILVLWLGRKRLTKLPI